MWRKHVRHLFASSTTVNVSAWRGQVSHGGHWTRKSRSIHPVFETSVRFTSNITLMHMASAYGADIACNS